MIYILYIRLRSVASHGGEQTTLLLSLPPWPEMTCEYKKQISGIEQHRFESLKGPVSAVPFLVCLVGRGLSEAMEVMDC